MRRKPVTGNVVVVLPNPVPVGQWTHVACTYDNANLTIFVNGVSAGSLFVGPKTVVNSASTFRLSADDNFNGFFHGLIDEAQIYNRAFHLRRSSPSLLQAAQGSAKKKSAFTGRRWRTGRRLANSPALNIALPNAYFSSLGLPTLAARG
jgi:hypothetical protein